MRNCRFWFSVNLNCLLIARLPISRLLARNELRGTAPSVPMGASIVKGLLVVIRSGWLRSSVSCMPFVLLRRSVRFAVEIDVKMLLTVKGWPV